MHLSMFLEVTDPRASSDDWSAFVSHRLAVVNQRDDTKSLAKESQNRYSRAAKDWGARPHWVIWSRGRGCEHLQAAGGLSSPVVD